MPSRKRGRQQSRQEGWRNHHGRRPVDKNVKLVPPVAVPLSPGVQEPPDLATIDPAPRPTDSGDPAPTSQEPTAPQEPKVAVLPLPKHLIVEQDRYRAALRGMLDQAFEILQATRSKVVFNFSQVERIFPGGMLVFLAHLQQMHLMYPGRVDVKAPPNSVAGQLIEHFRVFGMLGGRSSGIVPNHKSVIDWRYITGIGADGAQISELLDSYRAQIKAKIPDGLYDVLAEAFTNVRQHAFNDGGVSFEALKRWWLFSKYVAPDRFTNGNLYIAIYDMGVGIQTSMRSRLRRDEVIRERADDAVRRWMIEGKARQLDSVLLRRAVENERSATGLKNRGLGLPEMREFVQKTNGGRLYILSGQAQYSHIEEEGAGQVVGCNNGFPGTLILWSLPLGNKDEI